MNLKSHHGIDMGNTKILEDEDAMLVAENFVPYAIKEFFFFDGERLDNFFEKKKKVTRLVKLKIKYLLSPYFLIGYNGK